MAGLDGLHPNQGSEEPLSEEPASHRRLGRVEEIVEGGGGAVSTKRIDQFEVAARHLVEWHRSTRAQNGGSGDLRKAVRLQLARVVQQGAHGRNSRSIGRLNPQTVQARQTESSEEFFGRTVCVELPHRASRHHHLVT